MFAVSQICIIWSISFPVMLLTTISPPAFEIIAIFILPSVMSGYTTVQSFVLHETFGDYLQPDIVSISLK